MDFKFKTKNERIILIVFISLVISFIAEFYLIILENQDIFNLANLSNPLELFSYFSLLTWFISFVLSLLIVSVFLIPRFKDLTSDFLYKYRFPLAILIFFICVLFEIHGSSIAELNYSGMVHKPLFGISRSIRSDEYLVNTIFSFSQYFNGFNYFSDIVRATTTDMFLVYGQPTLDIGELFRPFHWGYLFLSPGKGLSFFWIGRLIGLLLTSFEMGMLLCKKNKTLALAYSLLITFAPLTQWWFAINGLVEILIFGQLAILLINYYMTNENYLKRLIAILGIVISIGTFALVLYPAWEIPFAYVFLVLTIWIIIENYKDFKYSKNDLKIIAIGILILAIIALHVFFKSHNANTLSLVMGTAYPGSRVYTGGATLSALFAYVRTLFYPIYSFNGANLCELTYFFDFFPIPIILFFILRIGYKNKDKLLRLLMVLWLIFLSFAAFSWSEFLAKISLLSFSQENRFMAVMSFISLLILIRGISLLNQESKENFKNIAGSYRLKFKDFIKNKKIILIISVLISIGLVYYNNSPGFTLTKKLMVILLFVLIISIYSILNNYSKKMQTLFLIMVLFISLFSGALVNPIESGVDAYYEQSIIQDVGSIVANDSDAKWIVEGSEIPGNLIVGVGAPTVNSVNTYPDLDRWKSIDLNVNTSNNSSNIYNRYAHILIILQKNQSSFELLQADSFYVYLNIDDLRKLDVKYILSTNDLNNLSTNETELKIMGNNDNYKIYEVVYENNQTIEKI